MVDPGVVADHITIDLGDCPSHIYRRRRRFKSDGVKRIGEWVALEAFFSAGEDVDDGGGGGAANAVIGSARG